MDEKVLPSSFRDPSGFLFTLRGKIYRQVNKGYKKDFDRLISSGLYKALVEEELLISHQEVSTKYAVSKEVYKVIRPEAIPFISYPYEWCFSQLKDAALLTLKIQKKALSFGMSLKDSSSFNVQLINGKPILIDTLSFEIYQERPWVAYRQFCEHFLAPLALMSKKDVRLNQLLRIYIDGIPLELTSKLLPAKTYFPSSLLSHIHLHAKSQKIFATRSKKVNEASILASFIPRQQLRSFGRGNPEERIKRLSKNSLLGLIGNLETTINGLAWSPKESAWSKYYKESNYSTRALKHKKQLVAKFLDKAHPRGLVWDLGANIGLFSRLVSAKGVLTVSFDNDAASVEKNYLSVKKNSEKNILPLVLNLANPSPALGWESIERESLLARGPADCVLVLALIHHLAIANNLPFAKIASFFAKISPNLIIEFVPKDDPNVKRLLASRVDIFGKYSETGFKKEFSKYFKIVKSEKIKGSSRSLYLMKRVR